MKLNKIGDNKGAHRRRKRLGRGIGSGKGKTSGHGQKGQRSRTGVALAGFEGGQMPLHRRMPKRGFHNLFRRNYQVINLGRLQAAIEAGKIDVKKPVTAATLVAAGILSRTWDGVRLLAQGELTSKITIEVAGASKTAVAAVEKAGGTVVILKPKAAPEAGAA
ncbi:MAG: 50S ribosomal protein L15 [Alphaproteobacteria bacterium]